MILQVEGKEGSNHLDDSYPLCTLWSIKCQIFLKNVFISIGFSVTDLLLPSGVQLPETVFKITSCIAVCCHCRYSVFKHESRHLSLLHTVPTSLEYCSKNSLFMNLRKFHVFVFIKHFKEYKWVLNGNESAKITHINNLMLAANKASCFKPQKQATDSVNCTWQAIPIGFNTRWLLYFLQLHTHSKLSLDWTYFEPANSFSINILYLCHVYTWKWRDNWQHITALN